MVAFKRVTLLTLLICPLFMALLFCEAGAEKLALQPLPEGGPSQRFKHSAIVDLEHNQMVFFGGRDVPGCLNDAWRLDLSNLSWSQIQATGSIPAARYAHSAIYDPVNKRMIIFGGTNPYAIYNDLFSLDLNTNSWSMLSPSGPLPNPRWNQSAIFYPKDTSMIVFGGRDIYQWYNDMWKLDLKTITWSQIVPIGQLPPVRDCNSAAYIPGGDYMLVFAGYANGATLSDLWKYDFATKTWSQIQPAGDTPLARGSYIASYDSLNNRLIIFGGIGSGTNDLLFDDIWQLDLSSFTWSKLLPQLARESPAGAYDPQRKGIIVFGGKVSYTLNYIFSDGYVLTPGAGSPLSYGDANCDGQITVTDIIYTINYLFKGGPAPCSASAK